MKKRKILLISFFLSLFALLVSPIVYAAIQGEGLTISPPISELTLDPGKKFEQTIRLTNPTASIVEVYPKAMDFAAAGEGGEPTFFERGSEDEKFSLASWISFSQSKIALAPEQVVEFKYTINVPLGAEPGGHYGVVFFATEPPENEAGSSQVALGSMIGSLVLVRVPGQIVEKGFLESFKTDQKIYFSHKKISLTARISNLGNIHFKPRGSIKIKNLFDVESEPLTFNEQNGNVLPDSTRKFENAWQANWFSIGPYKANLALEYGQDSNNLASEATFWIIPWWLIVIVVLLTALVIYLILKKKKQKKLQKNIKKNVDDNNSSSGSVMLR